jgi:hypothetical protein
MSERMEISQLKDNATETSPWTEIGVSYYGDVANVSWKSIPMSDLRLHPLFESLPEPFALDVSSVKDLCKFRQHTWQWDALHISRLTTSKIASILGFYEKNSSDYLSIPNSLQGHERVVEAWNHLRQKKTFPSDWSHLFQQPGMNVSDGAVSPWKVSDKTTLSNSVPEHPRIYFPYVYNPSSSSPVSDSLSSSSIKDPFSARLEWGNSQEATATLSLINYLCGNNLLHAESQTKVYECGLSLFEALEEEFNSTLASNSFSSCFDLSIITKRLSFYQEITQLIHEGKLPLIGASSDAVIINHQTKDKVVIEVKCFSPFSTNNSKDKENKKYTMKISNYHPNAEDRIPAWYIPQIQLEMFCHGIYCQSAYLVILFYDCSRIYEMKRDDCVRN